MFATCPGVSCDAGITTTTGGSCPCGTSRSSGDVRCQLFTTVTSRFAANTRVPRTKGTASQSARPFRCVTSHGRYQARLAASSTPATRIRHIPRTVVDPGRELGRTLIPARLRPTFFQIFAYPVYSMKSSRSLLSPTRASRESKTSRKVWQRLARF